MYKSRQTNSLKVISLVLYFISLLVCSAALMKDNIREKSVLFLCKPKKAVLVFWAAVSILWMLRVKNIVMLVNCEAPVCPFCRWSLWISDGRLVAGWRRARLVVLNANRSSTQVVLLSFTVLWSVKIWGEQKEGFVEETVRSRDAVSPPLPAALVTHPDQ